MPTRMNSAPVDTPWFTICSTAPVTPCGLSANRPEHDEAHVRDRRVRDELLDVALHPRDQRAVDDADDREPDDPRRPVDGGLREQRQRVAHEAEGAELQQHAREHRRARRRRLDVRVGQPGVEREHRHLDREREREHAEQEALPLPPRAARGRDRQVEDARSPPSRRSTRRSSAPNCCLVQPRQHEDARPASAGCRPSCR